MVKGTVHEYSMIHNIYSVMQSLSNSFGGGDVLESFIMAYRDVDSILYQINAKQIIFGLLL